MFSHFNPFSENPFLPTRWLSMANPTTGSTSGKEGGTTADDPATAKPPKATDKKNEDLSEEALTAEANEAWIGKIKSLALRDAISNDVAEQAEKALRQSKKTLQTLAKRLADQEIKEATFEVAHDALTKGNGSQKKLAQALVNQKIDAQHFDRAMDDLESGDPFLKPLAVRLGRGDIKPSDYDLAKKAFQSDDNDQKWAAQMLARGTLSAEAFRQKLDVRHAQDAEGGAEDHKKDPVSDMQKETHDKIMELLLTVDVVMEQLPERERTRPLQKLRDNLLTINRHDRENNDALNGYLHTLEEDQGLTPDDAKLIREFDADNDKAKAKEEFKEFRLALRAMKLSPGAIKNIMWFKEEEWKIEKDFLQQASITKDIMKSAVSVIHYETLKERMLDNATKITGIRLKEGKQNTPIQYVYPDAAHGNLRTQHITKVEVSDAPILDKINGEAIGRQPAMITIHMDNGEQYSLSKFAKWVNASDVHEVISTQVALEEAMELPPIGLSLKGGQEIEYTAAQKRNAKGDLEPQRERVEIESIDDQRVVFKKPVVTLKAEEDPSVDTDRVTREMTLGEFNKWVLRHEAVPQVKSVDELRKILRDYNTHCNNTWKRSAEEWPPITLEQGEVLQYGEDDKIQFQIDKVDDEGIRFKNGTRMTLPEFLGWVRANGVERSNPVDEAKREEKAAERLGEEINDAAKAGFFERAMAKFRGKSGDHGEHGGDHGGHGEGHGGGDHGKHGAHGGGHDAHGHGGFFSRWDPHAHHTGKPYGPIGELFNKYTYLSMMDLWNMGKELLEFIKRKHTRRSKGRYSQLGKALPSFLGTEFARVNQASETEEVNHYKEAMEHWGIWEIIGKLHNTTSKDEAKACFIVLTEKGELRWDDMHMWSALNRLTSTYTADGAALYIQHTREAQRNPKTGALTSGEDRTKDSIDALWGVGTWAEWFSHNINSYNNAKKAFEYKGKQLEGDPKNTGGLTNELRRLLTDWKEGRYVNPMEYEELIDFGIKYGKMGAEDKLFFLFEGITATPSKGPAVGETLLHMDRIGDLDGQYLNIFPMLDFFTNKGEKKSHPRFLNGEIDLKTTKRGYTVDDYQSYIKEYFPEESKNCTAGRKFSKFLWEWMMTDPNFRVRLSKGLRRAENMDHDDAHMYIPTATVEQTETFVGAFQGNQKYWTDPGYMNGYAGFNQYLVSLSNKHDTLKDFKKKGKKVDDDMLRETEKLMLEAVRSYFTFDSYLSGRRAPQDPHKARLGQEQYRQKMVVDKSCVVQDHKDQLDNLIKAICDAYGIDWKAKLLFEKPAYGDKRTQEEVETNMVKFIQNELPAALKEQGFEKMLKIVDQRKHLAVTDRDDKNALRGLDGSNTLLPEDKKGGSDLG